MDAPTIEHHLEYRAARHYALVRRRLFGALMEAFMSADRLQGFYSKEMLDLERFRVSLLHSVTADSKQGESAQANADRWAHFLKARAALMEPWSGFVTSLGAMFGAGSALMVLMRPDISSWVAWSVPITTACLIYLKARLDDRIGWYKFIAGQLEAVAKVGSTTGLR